MIIVMGFNHPHRNRIDKLMTNNEFLQRGVIPKTHHHCVCDSGKKKSSVIFVYFMCIYISIGVSIHFLTYQNRFWGALTPWSLRQAGKKGWTGE